MPKLLAPAKKPASAPAAIYNLNEGNCSAKEYATKESVNAAKKSTSATAPATAFLFFITITGKYTVPNTAPNAAAAIKTYA